MSQGSKDMPRTDVGKEGDMHNKPGDAGKTGGELGKQGGSGEKKEWEKDKPSGGMGDNKTPER